MSGKITGYPRGDYEQIFIGISIALLLFGNAELSADRLYTWIDAKGNLHITEHPPPKNAKTKNVMTYQPRTDAQIQKLEEDERREQMQDEPEQKKQKDRRLRKQAQSLNNRMKRRCISAGKVK